MPIKTASAPGKIILSGEYAVVFGFPGVASPVPLTVAAEWEQDTTPLQIRFSGLAPTTRGEMYVRRVIELCEASVDQKLGGTVTIQNGIPLGKGMGSSTALVIALCRCILGPDCENRARQIEDRLNPDHSGIDFATIWRNRPVLFRKESEPRDISLSPTLLDDAVLIDTGTPNETTPELVAWVRSREAEVRPHLKMIGQCTERFIRGEDPHAVFPDHHRAQVALGVVPPDVQNLIAEIEQNRGVAKVLGAGARTGGGGMVLAIGMTEKALQKITRQYDVFRTGGDQ